MLAAAVTISGVIDRNQHLARSAYIHVPFCAHHCGYCNFSVIADRLDLSDEYLTAIATEMAAVKCDRDEPMELDTLYLGGGTPTQLTCDQLRGLFAITRRTFHASPDCEITVEANPSDLDRAKVTTLAELGVNRISLGAQSFHTNHLAVLERDHRAEQSALALAPTHISTYGLTY